MTEPVVPATVPAVEPPNVAWTRREFYLKVISSLGLVFGLVLGIVQYTDLQRSQHEQRETIALNEHKQRADIANQLQEQREKDATIRQHELNLMIYREKKEAYGLLLDAAVGVATAKSRADVEANVPKFYAVYYGRVHIVPDLDLEVQNAKTAFSNVLEAYRNGDNAVAPIETFKSPVYEIAKACQHGLDIKTMDAKK